MIELLCKSLKIISLFFFTFIIFSGTAGPGLMLAAELICKPDCPMHQVKTMGASCCNVADAVHHSPEPCHGHAGKPLDRPSCSSMNPCVDAHIDIQKTALTCRGLPDTGPAIVQQPAIVTTSSGYPPAKVSLHPPPSHPPPPIYIQTCVFLI